jgi:hypothetical protein
VDDRSVWSGAAKKRSVGWRGRLPAVAALLAAAACDLTTAPALLPDGAVSFTPPAHYALWWDAVEACAGKEAQFSQVQWYVVPHAETFEIRGHEWAGWWWEAGNRIILAEGYRDRGLTVRHEMLHSILQRGDHPPAYFEQRCHGVVEP